MPHPFLPPFKLVEHGESYEVQDAAERHLAYFYFEDEETRRSIMNRMTKDEAKAAAGIFMRGLIREAGRRPVGKIGEGGEATFPDPK